MCVSPASSGWVWAAYGMVATHACVCVDVAGGIRLLDRCVQALNLLAVVFETRPISTLLKRLKPDVAKQLLDMDFRAFVVTRKALNVSHEMVQELMKQLQCVALCNIPPPALSASRLVLCYDSAAPARTAGRPRSWRPSSARKHTISSRRARTCFAWRSRLSSVWTACRPTRTSWRPWRYRCPRRSCACRGGGMSHRPLLTHLPAVCPASHVRRSRARS